jgi:hypothetical protein
MRNGKTGFCLREPEKNKKRNPRRLDFFFVSSILLWSKLQKYSAIWKYPAAFALGVSGQSHFLGSFEQFFCVPLAASVCSVSLYNQRLSFFLCCKKK